MRVVRDALCQNVNNYFYKRLGVFEIALYAYHRTSSTAQKLDRGIIEIEEFCKSREKEIKKFYTDQYTGKTFNRPGYKKLKRVLQSGDELIITEMDRVGRNKNQILKELNWLKEKKIRVYILEIPTTLMDLNMEQGMAKFIVQLINDLLFEIYSAFAELEMGKREKRQKEGIEAMKLRGDWELYGRPRKIPKEKFQREYKKVLNGKMTERQLKETLKLHSSTFSRYKKELFESKEKLDENSGKS